MRSARDEVWHRNKNQVSDRVQVGVEGRVQDQVWWGARLPVRVQIWDRVWSEIWEEVWEEVEDRA